MIKNETSPLVVDIAKEFISLVMTMEPNWSKAYFRFCSKKSVFEAKGSFVSDAEVKIIDVLKYKNFFFHLLKKGNNFWIC